MSATRGDPSAGMSSIDNLGVIPDGMNVEDKLQIQ